MFEGLTVAMVTPFRGRQRSTSRRRRGWSSSCSRAASRTWWCRARPARRRPARSRSAATLWRFVKERVRGTGPGGRGDRHELHRRQHRADADGRGAGARRRDARDALLQQADAARAGRALHGGGQEHAAAAHPLQRAGAHRDEHACPRRSRQLGTCRTSWPSRRPRAASIRRARSARARRSRCSRGRFADAADDRGGGDGVVSVAGNVAPREMRELCDHARPGGCAEAEEIHRKLLPLFKALFVESNPGPVKYPARPPWG